jgi:hypothetical protein
LEIDGELGSDGGKRVGRGLFFDIFIKQGKRCSGVLLGIALAAVGGLAGEGIRAAGVAT